MHHFYEHAAPSTGRGARMLARAYGFENPRELATSLPAGARVADFGSGKSNLGEKITAMRPDILWLNIDVRTGLFHHAQRHQRKSPAGLQYIKGSVFHPPVQPGTLDRVYSSWLLPHIELDSRTLALDAVHSMTRLLRPEGQINLMGWNTANAWRNEYDGSPDETAERLVDAIACGPIGRKIQVANNLVRVVTGLDKLP